MGRDHSITCDVCGVQYGGFNGPEFCGTCEPDRREAWEREQGREVGDDSCHACDNPYCRGDVCSLDNLGRNLAVVGALQWTWRLSQSHGNWVHIWDRDEDERPWHPGCGRPAIDAAREGES